MLSRKVYLSLVIALIAAGAIFWAGFLLGFGNTVEGIVVGLIALFLVAFAIVLHREE